MPISVPERLQIGLDERDHRRHRQDGQTQPHPGEPEQARRHPEFPHAVSRPRLVSRAQRSRARSVRSGALQPGLRYEASA